MTASERIKGANIIDAGRLSPYWGEHAARYVYAQQYVQDKMVLDIACGTGYGIGLLRSRAKFVTGVDIDAGAAGEAMSECGRNAAVILGDGSNLPFEDESFDVITSFETLEHLHERGKFLSELRRVLRPGAPILLSTPNANYTKPVNGKPGNPFHIYEYTPGELRDELRSQFSIVEMRGQMLDAGVRIPPFYGAQQLLPNDIGTQTMLFCWKAFNKIPVAVRETLSEYIWGKPFYPTERDYNFDMAAVDHAPVLFAVCQKD
jgi:SAM-dependent methyltransferase